MSDSDRHQLVLAIVLEHNSVPEQNRDIHERLRVRREIIATAGCNHAVALLIDRVRRQRYQRQYPNRRPIPLPAARRPHVTASDQHPHPRQGFAHIPGFPTDIFPTTCNTHCPLCGIQLNHLRFAERRQYSYYSCRLQSAHYCCQNCFNHTLGACAFCSRVNQRQFPNICLNGVWTGRAIYTASLTPPNLPNFQQLFADSDTTSIDAEPGLFHDDSDDDSDDE